MVMVNKTKIVTHSGDSRRLAAHKAIGSGELSTTEEIILRWQWGLYGDFFSSLMETIAHADESNLERLARAFPDEVTAYRAWTTTWIAETLRHRGLI